jgi:hypothetical protein
MHQVTGDAGLHDAAVRWLDHTLDLCDRTAQRGPQGEQLSRPWSGVGVLEGLAGVLLALASACTDAEPTWDQMLLVSTAGPSGMQRT